MLKRNVKAVNAKIVAAELKGISKPSPQPTKAKPSMNPVGPRARVPK
jgi:hypothetical protein